MIPLLPPGNHDRNGFFRVDGDGVHWAIHAAQMAHLAVSRIFDERLFGPRVLADYIHGTGLNAYSTTDTAFDTMYCHAIPYIP